MLLVCAPASRSGCCPCPTPCGCSAGTDSVSGSAQPAGKPRLYRLGDAKLIASLSAAVPANRLLTLPLANALAAEVPCIDLVSRIFPRRSASPASLGRMSPLALKPRHARFACRPDAVGAVVEHVVGTCRLKPCVVRHSSAPPGTSLNQIPASTSSSWRGTCRSARRFDSGICAGSRSKRPSLWTGKF
jgi:hypothetical protein